MLEKIGMAMVNPLVNLANVKDSQWLTLEVCREFQRNKCSRTDQECRYAHPPPHVEVQNGRVTACFDSIKGKCQRKDPPCKYLHPPQHLKEILLQNGKNNLYWKNRLQAMAQAQAYPYVPTPGIIPTVVPSYLYPQQIDPLPHSTSIVPAALKIDRAKELAERSHKVIQVPRPAVGPSVPKAVPYPAIVPGQYPVMHPFMPSIHAASGIPFNPYFSGIPMPTTMGLPGSASDGSLVAQQAVPGMMPVPMAAAAGAIQQQKAIRPDRLEVCREFQRGSCSRQPSECRYAHPPETVTVDASDNHVTVCMDHIKGKCSRDACRYFHPPPHLQAQIKATQQRACNSSGTSAMQSHALPQVVEVLTGKKRPRDPADDFVLTSMTGLSPYAKRLAVTDNKSGVPMYQPSMAAYQHALAVQPYLQAAPSFVQTTGADSTMPAYTSLAYQVDVTEGKVMLCPDAVMGGTCQRALCKLYHPSA